MILLVKIVRVRAVFDRYCKYDWLLIINFVCIVSGKLDSWEWDSGARDLSPVPQLNTRKTANCNFLEPMIQVKS